LHWFFIGYWILNGAGFLSWPLFFILVRMGQKAENSSGGFKMKSGIAFLY